MMPLLDFWVPGHAKTKGSLSVINSGRLTGRPVLRDTPASKRWRELVAYSARQAMIGVTQAWPLEDSVELRLNYYLAVTLEQLIGQGSGDIDKLERNIFDALQDAGVYVNDAQVVACHHAKWVSTASRLGAGVQIMVAMVGEG